MKKVFLALIFAMSICVACVVAPGPSGPEVAIAPPLPLTVELVDPYYVYGGFHYYYNNDRWYYSHSRGGPWRDLPREHYPKEVRIKGGWGHERGR
jgi:hypothetical protein